MYRSNIIISQSMNQHQPFEKHPFRNQDYYYNKRPRSLAAHSATSTWMKARAHKAERQRSVGFPKCHTFYCLFYLLSVWLHFSR